VALRTGLPAHDPAAFVFGTSLKELIGRIPNLDPTKEFRSAFQYGSILYGVAGYVAGQIAGQTWEEFTRQRVLKPLGMSATQLSLAEQKAAPDLALAHTVNDPLAAALSVAPQPFRNLDTAGPGGSMSSSITDMAKWLLLHLRKGKAGASQIVSESQLTQTHSPQMVTPADMPSPDWPDLSSYGLGWYLRPYRGAVIHYHEGSVFGFRSNVSLIPDQNAGVVVLTNLNGTALPTVVAFAALDRLLGLEPIPWNDRFQKQTAAEIDALKKAQGVAPPANRRPAHPLESYTGDFENPGYGSMSVILEGGRLKMKVNSDTFTFEPDQGDVFGIAFQAPQGGASLQLAKTTFMADSTGGIASVAIPFQPGAPDILFTRKAAAGSTAAALSLDQFAGTYLTNVTISVARNTTGALVLAIPGQSPLELTLMQGTRFGVKGVANATVDFKNGSSGASTGIVLNLPSGVVTASRQ